MQIEILGAEWLCVLDFDFVMKSWYYGIKTVGV
jgi:hypothetical protein